MVAVGQTFRRDEQDARVPQKKILTGRPSTHHTELVFKGSINPTPWLSGLLTLALTG